jgi:F0F1-type ATP synthase assembly protein I
MTPSEPSKTSVGASSDFGRYAGLGLQFVVTVALFGALGWWIDGKLGSTPWLLVAGVLTGGVVAFILILRSVPPAKSLPPKHPSKYDDTPFDPDEKPDS